MAFLNKDEVVALSGHAKVEMVEDASAFLALSRVEDQLDRFVVYGLNPKRVSVKDFDWGAYRSVYGPEVQVADAGILLVARHKRSGNVQAGFQADARSHWATAGTLVGLAE